MTADPLTDAVSERICSHMNRDHAEAVLAYARHFGDRPEAREATMLAVRPEGMELSADGETLVVPFDHQLSDSYFVVGHFHYVLFGGVVFAIFGAIAYWYPKATGRMMDERLGRWSFWILLLGFNLVFLPMHFSGILGMPRRIYTYQPDRGWEIWNLITTLGVPVQILGVGLFVWNMVRSLAKGAVAGDDPWDAWTLEWSTTSPPPEHNFDRVPTCTSARPLWDRKHPHDPDCNYE